MIIEFADAPAPANIIVGSGEDVGGAMQGEGEGTLIPPLVPEIVQTNTDVILGSSPDQGKAEHLPVPKPTENDPTISDAQVRGTGTTQGATAHPPVSHWQYVGVSLEWISGPPQESSRGPTYNPEKISVF